MTARREFCGGSPVDDPMVKGKTKVHHGPHHHLPTMHSRLLYRPTDAEDAYLRRVYYRGKGVYVIGPQVGDGEGPARDLVVGCFALPGPVCQLAGLTGELAQAFLIGPGE